MALFYLIRHGEPTYDNLMEHGFYGFGRDLAPLTEDGKKQAERTAKDARLKNAALILSSPYTRALQTAQIISRETGLRVEVELDLHEWVLDWENRYTTSEESFAMARGFTKYKGEYPQSETFRWETVSHMRERMRRVADKYAGYDKVIFVGHGMAFRSLAHIKTMRPAEIVEFNYEVGQTDCEYSFT